MNPRTDKELPGRGGGAQQPYCHCISHGSRRYVLSPTIVGDIQGPRVRLHPADWTTFGGVCAPNTTACAPRPSTWDGSFGSFWRTKPQAQSALPSALFRPWATPSAQATARRAATRSGWIAANVAACRWLKVRDVGRAVESLSTPRITGAHDRAALQPGTPDASLHGPGFW